MMVQYSVLALILKHTPLEKINNLWNIMFGIIRDDLTKMSMYNLQDLMIAYSVSTMEKNLLAFTFPHLMFTL